MQNLEVSSTTGTAAENGCNKSGGEVLLHGEDERTWSGRFVDKQ